MQKQKHRRKRRRIVSRIVYGVLAIAVLVIVINYEDFFRKPASETEQPESVPAVNQTVETLPEPVIPEPVTATILSGGDVILHSPFLSSSHYKKQDGSYKFDEIFRFIQEDYESADFTVLNLETTINDTTYSGYPTFRSPASIVTTLKDKSVDMCLIANNHIYDNGDHGFFCTLDTLKEEEMITLGGRKKANKKDYIIQDINGIKVGFMNYTYATGSDSNLMINAIPVNASTAPLINTFTYNDLDSFYQQIKDNLEKMENAGVDYTIAYLHWGNEYQLVESSFQQTIAEALCELGLDALIGGHPHVVQPVDLLTSDDQSHKMICLYSLGNHLSNQHREYMDSFPTGHTEDGIMSRLTLEKDHLGNVRVIAADVIPTWVYRRPNSSQAEYYIFSLEDESVIDEAEDLDIAKDYEESLARTNKIIKKGVKKINKSLPITVN